MEPRWLTDDELIAGAADVAGAPADPRITASVTTIVAGLGLALTPVATLMFRFDNPDALLVLLLVAAAWVAVGMISNRSPRRDP